VVRVFENGLGAIAPCFDRFPNFVVINAGSDRDGARDAVAAFVSVHVRGARAIYPPSQLIGRRAASVIILPANRFYPRDPVHYDRPPELLNRLPLLGRNAPSKPSRHH